MKVLVVDDDAVTRRVLKQILTGPMQASVVEAANGMGALDMINREQPDLVVLDLQMPGLDGIEALRTIRTWRHTRHLPVIVITSSADEAIVRSCLALKVTAYLTKPFDPAVVTARLQSVLGVAPEQHTA